MSPAMCGVGVTRPRPGAGLNPETGDVAPNLPETLALQDGEEVSFLRHVKSWLLVFILFVVVITAFGLGNIPKIIKIEESKGIIISISLSFNVFSLLLLVVANTLFNRAKRMGVEINRDLMKDYRTGILITFLLSTLVSLASTTSAYKHEYVAYAILCTLSVVIAMSIILALGLYQITTLLT